VFEAEPFAAILIAHGTHEFVQGEIVRFLKIRQQIEGLRERSDTPSEVRGRAPTALNALTAQKTRLVAADIV